MSIGDGRGAELGADVGEHLGVVRDGGALLKYQKDHPVAMLLPIPNGVRERGEVRSPAGGETVRPMPPLTGGRFGRYPAAMLSTRKRGRRSGVPWCRRTAAVPRRRAPETIRSAR